MLLTAKLFSDIRFATTKILSPMLLIDNYHYHHLNNVCLYSLMMGAACGLNLEQLRKLGTSAILHDYGKLFIPSEILTKPGKLNAQEWEIMKKHPTLGYKALSDSGHYSDQEILLPIVQHHERCNGEGYPYGVFKSDLQFNSRIISVADVYDAMISKRCYSDSVPHSIALKFISEQSGWQFDPVVVEALKQIADQVIKPSSN